MDAFDEGCGEKQQIKPIFHDLHADDPDPEMMEIESLCVKCGQNGITRLLLTKIPFYKEVVVISFSCDYCNWENNELQPAAKIQDKGVQFKLRVTHHKDLTRQMVKTKWASVSVPELDFEIPPCSQEGVITTIEGILERAYNELNSRQKELKLEDLESAIKVQEFLEKLGELKEGNTPFDFILNDCSGNSFLENIHAPKNDPQMEISKYERSKDDNILLGINDLETDVKEVSSEKNDKFTLGDFKEQINDEVLTFSTNCSLCNTPCATNMKVTYIPHFKEVVIMATVCDNCGHRTNEVKSGSKIEPLGTMITLKVTDVKDMTRDLLKSDTCNIKIPELELEVGSAALGGRFTTVEGLFQNMKEQLKESNPLITGDSAEPQLKERMDDFIKKFDEVIEGKRQVTVILDDPCGNSYLQNRHFPDPDPHMTVTQYKRTFEQDEELGLIDMKVENYQES